MEILGEYDEYLLPGFFNFFQCWSCIVVLQNDTFSGYFSLPVYCEYSTKHTEGPSWDINLASQYFVVIQLESATPFAFWINKGPKHLFYLFFPIWCKSFWDIDQGWLRVFGSSKLLQITKKKFNVELFKSEPVIINLIGRCHQRWNNRLKAATRKSTHSSR